QALAQALGDLIKLGRIENLVDHANDMDHPTRRLADSAVRQSVRHAAASERKRAAFEVEKPARAPRIGFRTSWQRQASSATRPRRGGCQQRARTQNPRS